MTDLASLIARLEAAEGAFSEDEAVRFAEDASAAGLCRNMDAVTLAEALEGDMNAAVAIIPKGSLWSLFCEDITPTARILRPTPGRSFVGVRYDTATAATAYLALCLAALKARAQG